MVIVNNSEVQQQSNANIYQFEISRAQLEMSQLAEIYGMTHELTIAKSQEIDLLINKCMIHGSRDAQRTKVS